MKRKEKREGEKMEKGKRRKEGIEKKRKKRKGHSLNNRMSSISATEVRS